MPVITSETIYIPRTYLKLESEDGLLRYEYCPSREYVRFAHGRLRLTVLKRLKETKELSSTYFQMRSVYAELNKIGNATIVGALWNCFGPPQDIYDDWKQSYSFFFDLIIQRQLMVSIRKLLNLKDDRFSDGVHLFMSVWDMKGNPSIQLRMPKRDERDYVLEDGKDILTDETRLYSLSYFTGFIKGYASSGQLHDFERTYPYGEAQGKKYGVRNGIPFDETLNRFK